MSSAKSQHLESHSIAQFEHTQQRDDDEDEVFTDSRSQPSSPSRPSSPASTPDKKRSPALENGSKEATAPINEPSGRTLGERQSGAELQAPALQANGSKQTEDAMATADPGDEEVLVKDLDTGRAVTVQKVPTALMHRPVHPLGCIIHHMNGLSLCQLRQHFSKHSLPHGHEVLTPYVLLLPTTLPTAKCMS